MTSIVLELQQDALNREVPVSDLLRKALVVARKLALTEFVTWIDHELDGYADSVPVPAYRKVKGQVRAWNPYRGWMPVINRNAKEAEALSTRNSGQSIAELEHLIEGHDDDGQLMMPFDPAVRNAVCKAMDFETEVSLFVSSGELIHIIDAVRTIILKWALQLEADGVRGEGLSFTKAEKSAAERTPHNVANFYGSVHGAQIHSPHSIQVNNALDADAIVKMVDSLVAALPKLKLDKAQKDEIEAEIRTVRAQVASPKPKPAILRESLSSIRSVLENAAGSATGQVLLNGLTALLAQ